MGCRRQLHGGLGGFIVALAILEGKGRARKPRLSEQTWQAWPEKIIWSKNFWEVQINVGLYL